MQHIVENLRDILRGDVYDDAETLRAHSTDASIFTVMPQIVVFPKDSKDVQALVRFVAEHKKENPSLSITPRAAGTDMSGGPLNESIIVNFTKYMNAFKGIDGNLATVEPGMYYRDFEKETFKHNLVLPSFTASKSINAVGGMVGNNSAGELSLVYGQTKEHVESLKVVFTDGEEYTVKKLNEHDLKQKMEQDDFEGEVYRKLYHLLEDNYETLTNAKPKVSKNAAGYYLWDVWDKTSFDLNQLLVGSQGTLCIVTEITFRLVPIYPHSRLLVLFLNDMTKISAIVKEVLKHNPQSFESYGKNTLKIAIQFLPGLIRKMGVKNLFALGLSFIPDIWILTRNIILGKGLPEIILLIDFSGDDESELERKIQETKEALKSFHITMRATRSEADAKKYWTIRRESFALLREHIRGKRTAPFVDDVIVDPKYLSQFLPRLNALVKKYPSLTYTIAGHAGNGNFHIIPLMDFKDESQIKIIPKLSEEVYSLVLEFGGSITAEHNDGLIRSPYLKKMYGERVYNLFVNTKYIFDPQNIFNPGKKVNSDMAYTLSHITKE